MKPFIINSALIVASIVLGVILASWTGAFYDSFTHAHLGGGLVFDTAGSEFILGIPLGLIFFLTLLITAFGRGTWKKWLILSLILPGLFELFYDLSHLYFPLMLGIIGYGVGWGVRKIISTYKPKPTR